MTHSVCAHCSVPIKFEETMVTRDGKAYCCKNCAAAMDEMADQPGRDDATQQDSERAMAAATREGEPRPNRPEARGRQYR